MEQAKETPGIAQKGHLTNPQKSIANVVGSALAGLWASGQRVSLAAGSSHAADEVTHSQASHKAEHAVPPSTKSPGATRTRHNTDKE